MRQEIQSQIERQNRLSESHPRLIGRLRLFGLLALLGPLFAGLNTLALEGVPQVEIRFIAAEASAPPADVVVVEKVVERVVYVPVDNLSGAVSPAQTETPQIAAGDSPGETPATEAAIDADSMPVALEPDIELPLTTAPVVIRAPVRPVADAAEPEDVAEVIEPEDAVAEEPEQADEAVAEAPADEPSPRVVVVHSMVWDGEQFVDSPDGPQIVMLAPEPDDRVEDADAGEVQAVSEDGESADEPEQTADASDGLEPDTDTPVRVGDGGDEPESGAVAAGDSEQVAAETDPMPVAETDEQPEPAADLVRSSEQIAENGDALEQIQALTNALEQAVQVAGLTEHAAEMTDDAEQVKAIGDEPELEPAVTDSPAPLGQSGESPEDLPSADDELADGAVSDDATQTAEASDMTDESDEAGDTEIAQEAAARARVPEAESEYAPDPSN